MQLREILWKILGPKTETEIWEWRSKEKLYCNINNLGRNQIRKWRFAGHAVRLDMNRITRWVSETTGRTRGKTGTKWVVKLGIRVERKNNLGNKYTQTNMGSSTIEGFRNRIGKHQWERKERRKNGRHSQRKNGREGGRGWRGKIKKRNHYWATHGSTEAITKWRV